LRNSLERNVHPVLGQQILHSNKLGEGGDAFSGQRLRSADGGWNVTGLNAEKLKVTLPLHVAPASCAFHFQ
jgi:hypothetical protein